MTDGMALFTDLYELTMLQAYVEEDMDDGAVFSLFVRRLPGRRNFLVACGLDSVLDYLENLRLAEDVCVRATGLDARRGGFDAVLIANATRPVTPDGGEDARREMTGAGVTMVSVPE